MRAGQVRRPGERPLGRLQVTLPGDPADHLEGLACHLGLNRLTPVAALGGPQRGPGQPVRLLQAAPARGDLRRAGVDLGGVGACRLAGDLDARGGLGPSGAGDRRPGDPQVQLRRPRRRRGPSRASSILPVSIARSTCPDITKTSVSASSTPVPQHGADQLPGPGQRLLGAGQRAGGQVAPPGLQQQRTGAGQRRRPVRPGPRPAHTTRPAGPDGPAPPPPAPGRPARPAPAAAARPGPPRG